MTNLTAKFNVFKIYDVASDMSQSNSVLINSRELRKPVIKERVLRERGKTERDTRIMSLLETLQQIT